MSERKTHKKPTPRSKTRSTSQRSLAADRGAATRLRRTEKKVGETRAKGRRLTKKATLKRAVPRNSPRGASDGAATVPPFMVASAQQMRAQRQQAAKGKSKLPKAQSIGRVFIIIVALIAACAVVLFIVSRMPVFTITTVEADATEHVSSESIVQLAAVDQGSTLLNFDEAGIAERIKRNPWVSEVSYTREFPNTLKISVGERSVKAIITMSSGELAWCLGSDDIWIEPLSIQVGDGESFNDAALAQAQQMGVILITDVPSSVSPQAGSTASDDTITAVESFQSDFSSSFSSQIVSYSAPSASSVSCVLSNGLSISLGSASEIGTKEAIISSLIDKYPDRLTYINVRVTSSPSYRMIDSEDVQSGSGTSS